MGLLAAGSQCRPRKGANPVSVARFRSQSFGCAIMIFFGLRTACIYCRRNTPLRARARPIRLVKIRCSGQRCSSLVVCYINMHV